MPPCLLPDGQSVHSGRISQVSNDFLQSLFLLYSRKDSVCGSCEYGLFRFIFESLSQNNHCQRWDDKWGVVFFLFWCDVKEENKHSGGSRRRGVLIVVFE